ncbi:hypothetical protein JCM9279_004715 [Rhodotorula babjevae]
MASTERKRKWDEPGSPSSASQDPAKHVKTEDDHGPLGNPDRDGDKAAAAAASIAARLATQYGAAPPPGQAPPPPPPGGGAAAGSAADSMGAGDRRERERERAQGLFVEDIEINDLRNRYLLTKGPTQQQILADTGAAVLTKGVWYPDKSMATEKDPALYLHITAETADKLEAGVRAVQALIDQELNLLDNRRGPPRGEDQARDSGYGQRRKWPEEKVLIELEPLRNFNLRAKTVGPGGMFVKWIQQETGTRVQIKGQGSGFIETDTGRESDDPLHVNIAGPDQAQIDRAAELARDLLKVVGEKHTEAREALNSYGGGGGGGGGQFTPSGANMQQFGAPMRFGAGGGPEQMGQMGQQQQQQQQNPYSYQPNQYAGAGLTAPLPPSEAPPAAPATGDEPAGAQAASGLSPEAYTAWWQSLDQASKDYYTQYYAAYAQYAANPSAAAAATPATPAAPSEPAPPAPPSDAPPPPPPASAAPPPPPPSDAPPAPPQGGQGRYGAVPPPAGL